MLRDGAAQAKDSEPYSRDLATALDRSGRVEVRRGSGSSGPLDVTYGLGM
jgi:hypothetical protein